MANNMTPKGSWILAGVMLLMVQCVRADNYYDRPPLSSANQYCSDLSAQSHIDIDHVSPACNIVKIYSNVTGYDD